MRYHAPMRVWIILAAALALALSACETAPPSTATRPAGPPSGVTPATAPPPAGTATLTSAAPTAGPSHTATPAGSARPARSSTPAGTVTTTHGAPPPGRTPTPTPTRAGTPTPAPSPQPPAGTPTLTPMPTPTALPPLSVPPGAQAFVYVTGGHLWEWDGREAQPVVTQGDILTDPPPQLAPDGRRMLLLRASGAHAGERYPSQNASIVTLATGAERVLDLAALSAPAGAWPIVVGAWWRPQGDALLLRTSAVNRNTTPATLATADEYWLADAGTGALRPIADLNDETGAGRAAAGAPVLSPDGRYAVVPAVDGLTVLDLDAGDARLLLPFEAALPPSAGWSADSLTMYAATPAEQSRTVIFWALDVATGAASELGRLPMADVVAPDNGLPLWSPGGAWVTWAGADGVVFLAPGTQPTQAQRWSTVRVTHLLGWSPGGDALAAAGVTARLLVLDATDANAPPALDRSASGDWQAVWWNATLIATARAASRTTVVTWRPFGQGAGPAVDWGFVPLGK
jgi:hypothetical protein